MDSAEVEGEYGPIFEEAVARQKRRGSGGSAPAETDRLLPSQAAEDDFDGTVWWRRPSLFWLLPPFLFTATITGASITPRLSLISDLLCRGYYMQEGAIGDCNIAPISAEISRLSAALNTCTGILAAIMAAKYGAWSDRSGRRWPLLIAMLGSLANDVTFVLVGRYYSSLTIYFLFVGAVCDGLAGSFTSSMAATYAYATDIVPPARRAVAFGYFQCCFFAGIAIGPTLGGYLVRRTSNVLLIFYIAAAIHATFALYTFFLLPESLSARRRDANREKLDRERQTHADWVGTGSVWLRMRESVNIFRSLNVFFPTDVPKKIRRNLLCLMSIDVALLLNMGAFTTLLLYTKYVFRWADLEQGLLLTIIGVVRVIVLLVVLPIIVRCVRGRLKDEPEPAATRVDDPDNEAAPLGADALDVILVRLSLALEVVAFSSYALAATSAQFYLAGTLSAVAGVGLPTIASTLTKHVPASRTGTLLGAVALMQSLNRVASPLLLGLLYAATVATHPATTFWLIAGLLAVAFTISLFLQPTYGPGVVQEEDDRPHDDDHVQA